MSTKCYCDRCGQEANPPRRVEMLAFEKEGRRYSTLSLSIQFSLRDGTPGGADICEECRQALKKLVQPWLP